MKKHLIIFLLVLLITISGKLFSQATILGMPDRLTPNGMFDTVINQQGKKFTLGSLNTMSARPFGNTYTISSVPTQSCIAGHFCLFFSPTSQVFSTGAQALVAQTALCEAYSNLSGFINSSIAPGSINIYCDDGNTGAGFGEAFYLLPSQPSNVNQGIVDGLIYQALTSGVDPYSTIPIIAFQNSGGVFASNFYHGRVLINPAALLNYSITTGTVNPTNADLYDVALHESLHTLGFLSLIREDGKSTFFPNINCYSRYDQFLQDVNGVPLLTTTNTACPNNYLAFNPLLTPSVAICQTTGTNAASNSTTNCLANAQYSSANISQTIAVYTPLTFEPGSSLSHFEDMCSLTSGFATTCTPAPLTPGYNNLCWLMCNYTDQGNCYVKRYPKQEEKQVLCDLGYTFSGSTFTSNAVNATHTYTNSCTPTATVIGLNDGYSGGVYTYTTTTASATISLASVLANDIPGSGLAVSCLEVVYNNATINGGLTNFTVTASIGAGLVILKYRPQNSLNVFGNATYIFVYFIPNGCGPVNSCNMIQNPGFENLSGLTVQTCGNLASNQVVLGCWAPYTGFSNVFTSGCTQNSGGNNLGVNTLGLTSPPVSSFSGGSNNSALGVVTGNGPNTGAIINNLSAPLLNSNSYRFSMWVQNPVGTGSTGVNPNALPVIINVASYTTFAFNPFSNFPTGLQPLTQFTVNAGNNWSYITSTFAYTPAIAGQAIIVGSNYLNSLSINQSSVSIHCFMDELDLEPVANPTFVLPQTNLCGNPTFTNLAQYASTVTGASAFTGTGVTFGGQYDFNLTQTLTPGVGYPIAYTYTNGCVNTIWQNAVIGNSLSISASGTTTFCANTGGTVGISASQSTVAGVTYTWQPGNLTGTAQVVSPTVTTIYTVTASNGFCSATATVGITVYTNCCGTNTYTGIGGTVIAVGQNNTGPQMITSDLTINSGASERLIGETVVAGNVKITVAGGGTLYISSAHLYACGSDQWKGIVIEDGALLAASQSSLFSFADNLIEDANVAIDVSTYTSSSITTILDITNTTFNKNFIDINISNYQRSSNSYSNAFNIRNCVFTCRDFAFTSSSWPSTSASDLRNAGVSTPTTGLDSPYPLESAPLATLLAPYAGQTSSIAICFNTVVVATGTNYYGTGLGSSTASEFNLFDNHNTFIDANQTNLTCINNVFQNTYFSGADPGNGSAIYHHTASSYPSNTFLSTLDMRPPTTSTQNRFWNCHRGVYCKNTYLFYIDKAIFRSTQNTSAYNSFVPGNTGISLNTNRFRYWINNCEFSNINNAINIPLTPDVSTLVATTCTSCISYGIFAGGIAIQQNTFSVGGSPTGYLNRAITITAPTNYPWTYAATSLTPALLGVHIEDNILDGVYHGIEVNGMCNFATRIAGNYVRLYEDNSIDLGQQHGIDMSNCSINNLSTDKHVITGNTLHSTGSTGTSTLSFPASLIYCGNNMGAGLFSPSVTCNNVSSSFNGFEFMGPNQGTMWEGNQMQDLARGMLLSNGGVIGTQGGPSFVMANGFNGSWAPGTNYGLYTFTSSASQSSLYVGSSGSDVPPNLFGIPFQLSYGWIGLGPITSYAGIGYDCFAPTSIAVNPSLPDPGDYNDDNSLYIARTAMYRYLYMNDSIRTSDPDYDNFVATLSGSSIDNFMQAEAALSVGDFTTAVYYSGLVTATNSIETNYKNYYTLYNSYATKNFEPTNGTDETNLINLAALCPGTDGACVYQARALYNAVFNSAPVYPACGGSSERMANKQEAENTASSWNIKLYPNPASNKLNIENSKENEILKITITDLSGRILLSTDLKLKGFIANLDLNLINGIYLATIINSDNEKLIKKLIISK